LFANASALRFFQTIPALPFNYLNTLLQTKPF